MAQHREEIGEQLPIIKVDEDKRLVAGWLYVMKLADGRQVVDVSGDYVDELDELEKAAHEFVIDSRNGDAMHDGRVVATMVESLITDPERMERMGIPAGTLPVGWYGVWRVQDDDVWAGVKSGRFRAFSVAGTGQRIPVAPLD